MGPLWAPMPPPGRAMCPVGSPSCHGLAGSLSKAAPLGALPLVPTQTRWPPQPPLGPPAARHGPPKNPMGPLWVPVPPPGRAICSVGSPKCLPRARHVPIRPRTRWLPVKSGSLGCSAAGPNTDPVAPTASPWTPRGQPRAPQEPHGSTMGSHAASWARHVPSGLPQLTRTRWLPVKSGSLGCSAAGPNTDPIAPTASPWTPRGPPRAPQEPHGSTMGSHAASWARHLPSGLPQVPPTGIPCAHSATDSLAPCHKRLPWVLCRWSQHRPGSGRLLNEGYLQCGSCLVLLHWSQQKTC